MSAHFESYERKDGLWGWQLFAANGEEVANDTGQGFRDRTDAARGIVACVEAVLGATAKLATDVLEGAGEDDDQGDRTDP